MTFFTLIISNYISPKNRGTHLITFLETGIASVLYWSYSERLSDGNLRSYTLVQFSPMLLIPLIIVLYKNKNNHSYYIFPVLAFYALAKLSEHFDQLI